MTKGVYLDGGTRVVGGADPRHPRDNCAAARPIDSSWLDLPANNRGRVIGGSFLILLVGSFLLLKTFALAPHPNDDGLYFYAALRWAQGALPYRDFFHAHPPLHLAPTALLFGSAGYSFALGKAVVFTAAAFQGILGHRLVRRLLRSVAFPVIGEAAALVTTVALLLCPLFLSASSDDTGLVQSTTLLALSGTAVALGWPWLAGCAAGAAVMTSLQTAPLAACLVVSAAVLAGRRSAFRVGVAATALVLLINLLSFAVAGGRFIEQVYLFHLAKATNTGEGWQTALVVLRQNWVLTVLAATGAATLVGIGGNARRLGLLLAGSTLLHFVVMATRPRVFYWYFLPALYPAAVLAGLGVAAIGQALLLCWRRQGDARLRNSAVGALAMAAVAATFVVLHRPPLLGMRSPHAVLPYEMRRTYTWNGHASNPLNRVIRQLFWSDGRRVDASRAGVITEYLWRQSMSLDTLPAMTSKIRGIAATRPGTMLFGDYSVVPLVALEADVPVAEDFIDTTAQRMAARFSRFSEIEELLARRPNTLVLLRSSGGLVGNVRFEALIASNYQLISTFRSNSGVRHALYQRRSISNRKGAHLDTISGRR